VPEIHDQVFSFLCMMSAVQEKHCVSGASA
jgi:hypothetical protein